MAVLTKRDNMGYEIHPVLIVLLIMLGAAALVVCGAAISRLRGKWDTEALAFKNRSPEQESYMKEVRDRNVEGLIYEGKKSHMKQPLYNQRASPFSKTTDERS